MALVGFFILIFGFIYSISFAGFPLLDPTPELLARQGFHQSIANQFFIVGSIVFLLGILILPFMKLKPSKE